MCRYRYMQGLEFSFKLFPISELSSSFDLEFAAAGVTVYSSLSGELSDQNLYEVTLTFWMKTDDSANYGTPLSYARDAQDNAFTLMDYSGFVYCCRILHLYMFQP